MKRKSAALLLCCVCLCGCGIQQPETPPAAGHIQITASETQTQPAGKLNEWQIKLLESKGLPTDYEELSLTQQNTIDRAWTMISYLNEKYGEEFVYEKYIPKELNQSETLVAYPRSTGSGDGKYLVTVKTKDDGFTDDYSDFSVTDLAEKLTDDFLTEQFGNNYKYFISPLACDIKKAEIKDGKFQWKYGAENRIFISEEQCSINCIEDFALRYARFLFEHEIDGRHRIEILKDFPKDDGIWKRHGEDLFRNIDGSSTGFCIITADAFSSSPTKFHMNYVKYNLNAEKPWVEEYNTSKDYLVDRYFANIN